MIEPRSASMRRTWLAILLLLPLRLLAQPDTSVTRLLHSPTVSRDHIAFVNADDLWVCDLDSRNVRLLTSDPGVERDPAFSPDGRTIAFTGQYDAPARASGSRPRTSIPSPSPAASPPG